MRKRQKRDIFQRYPEVWQKFAHKFWYELAKFSFVGLVVGGFVTKEVLGDRIVWGIILTTLFALTGLWFDYSTRR